MEFHFKKGVYKLNEQSNFDFQLNRVVMWDGGDPEEIKAVGPDIKKWGFLQGIENIGNEKGEGQEWVCGVTGHDRSCICGSERIWSPDKDYEGKLQRIFHASDRGSRFYEGVCPAAGH